MPSCWPDVFQLRPGSCDSRFQTWLMSFQWIRSLLAYIGMPGKAMKVEIAQKKVELALWKMQLGSLCHPGSTGLKYVELMARHTESMPPRRLRASFMISAA
jgi:hypothetical protein